jgi:hypothetical protein
MRVNKINILITFLAIFCARDVFAQGYDINWWTPWRYASGPAYGPGDNEFSISRPFAVNNSVFWGGPYTHESTGNLNVVGFARNDSMGAGVSASLDIGSDSYVYVSTFIEVYKGFQIIARPKDNESVYYQEGLKVIFDIDGELGGVSGGGSVLSTFSVDLKTPWGGDPAQAELRFERSTLDENGGVFSHTGQNYSIDATYGDDVVSIDHLRLSGTSFFGGNPSFPNEYSHFISVEMVAGVSFLPQGPWFGPSAISDFSKTLRIESIQTLDGIPVDEAGISVEIIPIISVPEVPSMYLVAGAAFILFAGARLRSVRSSAAAL